MFESSSDWNSGSQKLSKTETSHVQRKRRKDNKLPKKKAFIYCTAWFLLLLCLALHAGYMSLHNKILKCDTEIECIIPSAPFRLWYQLARNAILRFATPLYWPLSLA